MRAIFTERGERHEVKTERFADHIRGDFAQGKGTFRKIPEGLLAFGRFINGSIFCTFIMNSNEEGVIGTEHELPFEFQFPLLEGSLKIR